MLGEAARPYACRLQNVSAPAIKYLKISEAAKALGLTHSQLRDRVRKGLIKATVRGGEKRYSEREIARLRAAISKEAGQEEPAEQFAVTLLAEGKTFGEVALAADVTVARVAELSALMGKSRTSARESEDERQSSDRVRVMRARRETALKKLDEDEEP